MIGNDTAATFMDTMERPDNGVLRTNLVAALAGVTPNYLGRWHRSGLLPANTYSGGRGALRLYSWVDLMKARAARKLLDAGVKPKQLQPAIDYLEEAVPEWYLLPLHEFAGRVLLDMDDRLRTAAHASQFAFPDIVHHAPSVLRSLSEEGPLGVLHEYGDVIEMHPRILGGNPVIRGTRLETRFLAELARRGVPPDRIAKSYRLTPEQVDRAIAFTKIAA